jgi:hypothetical protein
MMMQKRQKMQASTIQEEPSNKATDNAPTNKTLKMPVAPGKRKYKE